MMFGKIFGKSPAPSFGKQSTEPQRNADPKQVWVHSFYSAEGIPTASLTKLPGGANEKFRPHWMPGLGKVVPFHLEDYPQQFRMHEHDDGRNASTDLTFPTLPDFFNLGVLCVAKKYADVMSRYNLGKSQFFPITVFRHDGETRYDGEYFGIYFGETKAAVSYPESSGLKIFNSMVGPLFDIRIVPEHGQFAVRASALDELDMWIDPQCYSVFFISGRLMQALDDVGLTPAFHFKTCRMI
jgi:hypothetical protein